MLIVPGSCIYLQCLTHTHEHAFPFCTYIHTPMNIHPLLDIHTIYTHTHEHMLPFRHIYTIQHTPVNILSLLQTHTHTQTHIDTHTYTYTKPNSNESRIYPNYPDL